MVSFLYIVYEHLLAFRGPTRSGYYGGKASLKVQKSPWFLLVHCLRAPVWFSSCLFIYKCLFAFPGPTPTGHYGGMILAESAEDLHGVPLVRCLRAPVTPR